MNIFVNVEIYEYINQQIQVKWNNMISPTCTISNGVK